MQNNFERKKVNFFASQTSFCKTRHIKENYFRSRQIIHLEFHARTNYLHQRKSKNVDRVSFKNERSNKTNKSNCYEHTQEKDLRDLKSEKVSIKLRYYLITIVLFANR